MTAWRPRIVCAVALVWSAWVLAHALGLPADWQIRIVESHVGAPSAWREALARGSRAAAGAALTLLAWWQIGRRLERLLVPASVGPLARAQFALALGALAVGEILLALALAGAYRPAVVVVLLIACLVSRPAGLVSDIGLVAAQLKKGRASIAAADFVWILPGVLACGFALVGALAPETEYDALWYHLWLPTQWLAAGRLIDIVQEYPSLYPGAWELANGAAMAAGGPVAAKLLHFAAAPLTAAAACLVAGYISPRTSRWLVAALTLTAPTVMWEASTAYVDLALSWFVALAVVGMIRYHASGDRRWLLLCALMAGAAMGVKHLGLVVLAILAGVLLVREAAKGSVRRAIGAVAVFALVALTIPLPWYVRAYAAAGNPVFPEMYGVFGAQPDTRWSPGVEQSLARFKAHFGMGRTPAALVALPWDITTHAARFGGSIGPLFLAFVPFAAAARRRRRLAALLLGVLAYVAVWASPLGSFQLRFLMPIVPALAVIAAAGADVIVDSARRLGAPAAVAVRLGVMALLLVNLPPFIDWHDAGRDGADPWLTQVLHGAPAGVVAGSESADDYLARLVPTYRAWQAIDARTAPDARVLTFVSGDQLYSHRARLWSDSAMATPITWGALAGAEPRMLDAAARAGITHVLFDKRQMAADGMSRLALASADTRARYFAPFYEDGRIEVVRLVYPDSGETRSAPSDR